MMRKMILGGVLAICVSTPVSAMAGFVVNTNNLGQIVSMKGLTVGAKTFDITFTDDNWSNNTSYKMSSGTTKAFLEALTGQLGGLSSTAVFNGGATEAYVASTYTDATYGSISLSGGVYNANAIDQFASYGDVVFYNPLVGAGGITGMFVADVTAVPIPASGLLFGSAMLGLYGVARRKRYSYRASLGTS